jgi:hypothetical protein
MGLSLLFARIALNRDAEGIASHPAGHIIAVTSDDVVTLYDHDWTHLRALPGRAGSATLVAFNPSGSYLVADFRPPRTMDRRVSNGYTRVWEVETLHGGQLGEGSIDDDLARAMKHTTEHAGRQLHDDMASASVEVDAVRTILQEGISRALAAALLKRDVLSGRLVMAVFRTSGATDLPSTGISICHRWSK